MKARRYVRIARHRVAVDGRQYDILEAIAKVKDERHEPRTVAEMYAMAIGEFVMAELKRIGGRSGRFRALLPAGVTAMRQVLAKADGPLPGAIRVSLRCWIRDVEQELKDARRLMQTKSRRG